MAQGFAAEPSPRVSMIVLGVTDVARSVQFYEQILGLELAGEPGEVTVFRVGDIMLVLNHGLARATEGNIAGAMEIVFPVESVAASHTSLTQCGCTFVRAPREIFSETWAATFSDPDGHLLTILGPR